MLRKVTTEIFLLALVLISWKPALAQGCNPAGCFTQTALTDITSPYHGFLGGLYGGYSNSPTPTQLTRLQAAVSSLHSIDTTGSSCTGGPASNPCKILMLTTGMSIGKFEWLATPAYGYGNFTSPQIADVYSVIWRLGEAKEQTPPPLNPPYINPYFYAVVGNMNGHFAASWANDDMNSIWPGNYTQVNVNVINPQWYPDMFHKADVQKYIVDSTGYVEEATNTLMGATGTTEPHWTMHAGDIIHDGSVTWKNDGGQNTISKVIYTFSPTQVQIVHISNFTGLQFTQVGTVSTTAGSTTITQTGGDPFITPSTSDGDWNNVPLVLTSGSSHLTCGSKQCIVNTVSSPTQLTTTVPVDAPGGSASYALGVGLGVAGDPTCDGTWWTSACPNWEYLEWLDAQNLREVRFQYPNTKLIFLGGVDYCGYHDTVTPGRDAPGACLEPYNYETWLTTQKLVMDQTAEMDSQATLKTCSALHGSEICNASSLPAQYIGSVYVHVAGTSNVALNTPCVPSNCPGLLATVSGNNLSFTNPGVNGTSTGGHVTIVADAIAGSLESTAGTTAPIAISEYTWTPGPVQRGDLFGPMPAEAYICDGIHPSAGSSGGCTEAATCSSQVTVPGGDEPLWTYITNPPWCGQGYLSNQTLNFMVDNYFYSRQNWFSSVICAAGHTTPGCN
jgi:hypothetical protein